MNAHASITDTRLPDPSAWAILAPAERFALAQIKRLRPNGLVIAELDARHDNAERELQALRASNAALEGRCRGYRLWAIYGSPFVATVAAVLAVAVKAWTA